MWCSNNLKQIGLALHNYHDVYKSFPPAYVADASGRPMHSWRVLLLPFLEQQDLYEAYSFDEPWNGPNNRELLSQVLPVYFCPNQSGHGRKSATHTNYVAVVGAVTAWPGGESTSHREINEAGATILVCEISDRRIPWMKPVDLTHADAMALLTSVDASKPTGHVLQSFFYEWSNGRQVAMADGSVVFIEQGIGANDASRLLDKGNDFPLEVGSVPGTSLEARRLRTRNCVRLAVFALIVLWPLPWVWINPRRTTPDPNEDSADVEEWGNEPFENSP